MVDREEVLRIARLARLELRPDDVDRLAEQFGRILDYMELLAELDDGEAGAGGLPAETTREVAARSVATPAGPLRADEPRAGLPRDRALAAAPRSDGETFLVPPVIPDEETA